MYFSMSLEVGGESQLTQYAVGTALGLNFANFGLTFGRRVLGR